MAITLIGLIGVGGCSSANNWAGDVIEVPADPSSGFNYPYFLSIPDAAHASLRPWLVVESNNTGKVSDDYGVHLSRAESQAQGNAVGGMIAGELGLPLLTPVFPRPETGWETYTHALDQDCMAIESGDLRRIDLQLLAMVDDARQRLAARGWVVGQKVVLAGFSASASLANRMSLLHPERVGAVVAGGLNGILMVPFAEANGIELDYPLGTHDYARITGREFPLEAWVAIPQFLFMGEEDDNDAAHYGDAYPEAQRSALYGALGETMQPDRWSRCQQLYIDAGANATFRTYEGVGHGTNGEIHGELVEFVRAVVGTP